MKTLQPFGFVLPPLVCATAIAAALIGFLVRTPQGTHRPGGREAPSLPSAELCAGDHPASSSNDCPGLVELVVRDVIPLEEAQSHAVVLVSRDQEVVVPIFVDEGAAVAIAFRLAHQAAPQPLAQDLLDKVVSSLGARVTGVRIDGVREHMMITHVFLEQGKRHLGLSARPSDAVALALSSGTRIWATPQVVKSAGITREQIQELNQAPPGVGGSGAAGREPPEGGDAREPGGLQEPPGKAPFTL